MRITEYMKDHRLFLDGGMGTLLQARGLTPGELPERWNLTHPDVITEIHRDYFDAGSHVVNANTFGASPLKFDSAELESIVCAAMENARRARDESRTEHPKWIALDIGPTGKLLRPLGTLDFEDAVAAFAEVVKLGVKYGADLIFIETMNDCYETKAALLAAKENSDLPVFVSNAYGEDGKLMTGASPEAMTAMLEGMGADAVGVNCSLGPKALSGVVRQYLRCASVPVLLKPNAGLPRVENGRTVYDVDPAEFAGDVASLLREGVHIAGGCCGTTPDYIRALTEAAKEIAPVPTVEKTETTVSSYTHAVTFGQRPILIGERINPTGKKKFKEALRAGDMDYIRTEGIAQQEKGVDILDVNVGLPEIDEPAMLTDAVTCLQEILDLPLQIDTADPAAMERALRRYNGKALINSVSGKRESMEAVFPLAKKYGGVVVALTLDESGIPATAEERLAIARRILDTAAEYGIKKKDILFDPLALTVSADNTAARQTLRAVGMIRRELGCPVSLGVSNVSFGLPQRDAVNSTFFAMALTEGLSAAIMNPYSAEMMKTYHAYLALSGQDDNCASYIQFAETLPAPAAVQGTAGASAPADKGDPLSPLKKAIVRGMSEQAVSLTEEMLQSAAPMDIVQGEILPALDIVGQDYEQKKIYLPQLLMSAEAVRAAFARIRQAMPAGEGSRCAVVLATVKGDVHDIGKNIVRLLLENYGFAVCDLGRDVEPEKIAEEAVRLHAPLVGLSALMTTTVPAMEETIRVLRERAPFCKVVVGGAVLTREYADAIGADRYAKDAMETVRYAEEIEKENE